MLGGDTAIAATQYSYLPSWISFLVDKSKAQEPGVALFEAVYEAWKQLPADHRPSCTSRGEPRLVRRPGGIPLAGRHGRPDRRRCARGTPNFTELSSTLVANRDADHPSVCRCTERCDRALVSAPRTSSNRQHVGPAPHHLPSARIRPHRVVVAQPAPAPAGLAARAPGTDVLPATQWLPWVTFWQVTADMVYSTGVPDGHGHVYKREYVDAWAAVTQPAGWTAADTTRLRKLIG